MDAGDKYPDHQKAEMSQNLRGEIFIGEKLATNGAKSRDQWRQDYSLSKEDFSRRNGGPAWTSLLQ